MGTMAVRPVLRLVTQSHKHTHTNQPTRLFILCPRPPPRRPATASPICARARGKRYDYSEQDAVFAIQAALKQRKFDKPTDIPGFEGTLDALNSLSIREEEDEPSAKDVKSSSKDSVSKIASKLQQTTKEMKSLVKKWKNSEGGEKDKLTSRLKDLTKIKKELEGLL